MTRFTVPVPDCEVQGNKTLLRNFKQLHRALRRDPRYLSKFLSKGLATHGKIRGDGLLLHGNFSVDMIWREIESHVREFVCCRECFKRGGKCCPDTNLVREGKLLFLECEACGAKYQVATI